MATGPVPCRTTRRSDATLPHKHGVSGLRHHMCISPAGHGGKHACLCGARY